VPEPRRKLLAGFAAFVLVLVGLAGCAVSATDRPIDEGDAAVAGDAAVGSAPLDPPTPNLATTQGDLVSYFLQAAAGGLAGANDRVKAFLTANARAVWQDPVNVGNPSLTVIRVVLNSQTVGIPVGNRAPVSLDYQIVGTLGDRGRIDELAPAETRHLTFWVVPDDGAAASLRIDQIDGWPKGLLLLSDQALTYYYQAQPIYFWDTGYTLLVPDVRYVPLTLSPDLRAGKKLDWLVNGPSPWLTRVQGLPPGTTSTNPVISGDQGTLQVSLSAEAAAGGQDALRHLMIQLQWSLLNPDTTSRIDLRIGDQAVPADVDLTTLRKANHSYTYRGAEPTRYDIKKDDKDDGVVVDVAGNPVPLLGSGNTGVRTAAIDDQDGVAAVVRTDNVGRSVLQLAIAGQSTYLATQVSSGNQLGRPSFVPCGACASPGKPLVLVPTGGPNGRLLAVSTVDGSATDVTPTTPGVTAAAVSPDGRRVAVVAGGAVYVASLAIDGNGTLTVGSTPRQVLGGLLDASSVTWTAESWLLVGGTNGGAVALWKVSDDGVIAQDVTKYAGTAVVEDLVAYPQWITGNQSNVDALAVTSQGVYAFRGVASFSPIALRAPFYGS
jgi:hypothetical protein